MTQEKTRETEYVERQALDSDVQKSLDGSTPETNIIQYICISKKIIKQTKSKSMNGYHGVCECSAVLCKIKCISNARIVQEVQEPRSRLWPKPTTL